MSVVNVGLGVDIDGRVQHIDSLLAFLESRIALMVAFGKSIPGFKDLPLDDQANLIKCTITEVLRSSLCV